ncbi:senescence/dehydration-associated protein [Quercus suber]|uniref:Senescence/dehydration-associated protein n=1 Tax=Quercus suber TaxID=58331 RepID=A0AAW0K2H1_QUESU
MIEKVATGVLSGVVKVSRFLTGSVANSRVGKKFFGLLPGEIVLASLDGFRPSSVSVTSTLTIGGFPRIRVSAGYDSKRVPIGICFRKLKGSEPKLIEIAYGFEQATKIRKPPSFEPSDEAKNGR